MYFRLLNLTRHRVWNRFAFSIRYFSRFLAPRSKNFIVVGEVDSTDDSEFRRRMEYYLGGDPPAHVLWKPGKEWQKIKIGSAKVEKLPAPSFFERLWTVVTGRILFAKETRAARLLDRALCYKCYLVDSRQTYRHSAWRFTAAIHAPRFRDVFARWKNVQHRGGSVVVLGNGPSAELVFEAPYRDLPVIVCNTAVKSSRLRSRVAGVCICDALYFIAPTAYTARFHEALRQALAERPFPIVIDAEHLTFYRRRCPWISEPLLLPVIMDRHFRPNGNLLGTPVQRTHVSVFPGLMLPFAASIYDTIHLIGFDGKDPNLKNYFWKHNEEFQFHDELPSVKAHDHGFFACNDEAFYDRYNAVYSEQVEHMLQLVEAEGRQVVMAHTSFVPALAKRFRDAGADPLEAPKMAR